MNKLCLTTFLAASMLGGCATIFTPSHDPVTINSEPVGAVVYMDGARVGKTPTTLQVKRQLTPPRIELKSDGYYPQTVVLQNSFNAVALLDIFFWPGFIVDAATGTLMKASQNNYEAELEMKAAQ